MRILSPQDDQRIYYFAFGANLSPEVLKQRHMAIYETIDHTLENADLRFTLSGFYKDHGFASADAAVGEKVYGKLYLISRRDVKRMDYFEERSTIKYWVIIRANRFFIIVQQQLRKTSNRLKNT